MIRTPYCNVLYTANRTALPSFKTSRKENLLRFQGGNDLFISSSGHNAHNVKSEALETSMHLSSLFVDEMHHILPGAAIAKFMYVAKQHINGTNKSRQDKLLAQRFKEYFANPSESTSKALQITADKISDERTGYSETPTYADVTGEYYIKVLDNFGQSLKTIDSFNLPSSSASQDRSDIDKVISTLGTQFPATALGMSGISSKAKCEARSRLIAFDRFDIDKALGVSHLVQDLFKTGFYGELGQVCLSRYALARDGKDISSPSYPSSRQFNLNTEINNLLKLRKAVKEDLGEAFTFQKLNFWMDTPGHLYNGDPRNYRSYGDSLYHVNYIDKSGKHPECDGSNRFIYQKRDEWDDKSNLFIDFLMSSHSDEYIRNNHRSIFQKMQIEDVGYRRNPDIDDSCVIQ